MSFLTRESSRRSSAPVQLLQVVIGETTYALTPNDEAQVHDLVTYEPAPLTITPPESGSGDAGVLTFELPVTHALAVAIRAATVAEPAAVTVFDRHRGDAEFLGSFLGEVGVSAVQAERLVVTCNGIVARLKRKFPTMIVAPTCANQLYDARCQVDPDAFQYDAGLVTAIDGRVVTVSGAGAFVGTDSTYFAGGVLTKDGAIVGFITRADGDDLTLLADPPSNLAVDDAVTVLAGCDRTIITCLTRFQNQQHCNCWHTRPLRNPFTGRGLRP